MISDRAYDLLLRQWYFQCDHLVWSALLTAFERDEDFSPIILPAPPIDLWPTVHASIWRIETEQQRIYL